MKISIIIAAAFLSLSANATVITKPDEIAQYAQAVQYALQTIPITSCQSQLGENVDYADILGVVNSATNLVKSESGTTPLLVFSTEQKVLNAFGYVVSVSTDNESRKVTEIAIRVYKVVLGNTGNLRNPEIKNINKVVQITTCK